jgi:hypothetical protein
MVETPETCQIIFAEIRFSSNNFWIAINASLTLAKFMPRSSTGSFHNSDSARIDQIYKLAHVFFPCGYRNICRQFVRNFLLWSAIKPENAAIKFY